MPVGIDIGTAFIVSCREKEGKTVFKKQRDGFYVLEAETALNAKFLEQGLNKSKVPFFKKGNKYFIIGEDALRKALERRSVLKRPLHRGVINSREPEALEMIKHIISGVVGKPSEENEKCVYSIPENPVDSDFDIVYHKNVLNQILTELGYSPNSLNEAEAIAYSTLMDEGLTGLSVSCGAGMSNFSLMSDGKSEVLFSVAMGGDFIDQKVATSLGLTSSLVQVEKENGLNLNDPQGKIHKALAIYYDFFIKSVFSAASKKFNSTSTLPKFSKPLKVVVAGGTSIPEGFVERCKVVLETLDFPFEVESVIKPSSPLMTVANGCYLASTL